MSTKVRIINKWTIEYGKLSKSRLCNVAKVGGDKAHNIRCATMKGSIPWLQTLLVHAGPCALGYLNCVGYGPFPLCCPLWALELSCALPMGPLCFCPPVGPLCLVPCCGPFVLCPWAFSFILFLYALHLLFHLMVCFPAIQCIIHFAHRTQIH